MCHLCRYRLALLTRLTVCSPVRKVIPANEFDLTSVSAGLYEPEALPVNITVGEASSGPEGTAATDAINRPMLQMVVPTRRRPGDVRTDVPQTRVR